MAAEYWIRRKGRHRGPLSLEELRALEAQAPLPEDLEISESADGVYYRIETMRYLFEAPEPLPSIPPPGAASGRGAVPASSPHAGGPRPVVAPVGKARMPRGQASTTPMRGPAGALRAPRASEEGPVSQARPSVPAAFRVAAACGLIAALAVLFASLGNTPWLTATARDSGGSLSASLHGFTLIAPDESRIESSWGQAQGSFGEAAEQSPEFYGGMQEARAAFQQSRYLSLGCVLLIGVGAILALIAGVTVQPGKKIAPTWALCLAVCTLLAALCFGVFTQLGAIRSMTETWGESQAPQLALHTGAIWLIVGIGACLVAVIALIAGNGRVPSLPLRRSARI